MSEKNRTPNKCKNTIIIIAHHLHSVNLFQDLKVVADAGVGKSRKLSENRNGIGSGRTLSAAETWGLTKRKRVHILMALSTLSILTVPPAFRHGECQATHDKGEIMVKKSNTVTCSFTMDRDIYNAYKSIVAGNGENVKGNLVRYMMNVIRYETPDAETIAAIEEVQKMKEDSNKKTYRSFAGLLGESDKE